MEIVENLGKEDLVVLFQEKTPKTNSHLYIPIKDFVVSSYIDERNHREITKPLDPFEEISFHHFENPIYTKASGTQRRKRVNNFKGSMFSIVTMHSHSNLSFGGNVFYATKSLQTNYSLSTRITIYKDHPICWKTSNQSRELILLLDLIQELLEIKVKILFVLLLKSLMNECAKIDNIYVIIYGYHLFLGDIDQL